jgi:hypothetical protein
MQITDIIRWILSVVLVIGVFFETGIFTAIFAALVTYAFEVINKTLYV